MAALKKSIGEAPGKPKVKAGAPPAALVTNISSSSSTKNALVQLEPARRVRSRVRMRRWSWRRWRGRVSSGPRQAVAPRIERMAAVGVSEPMRRYRIGDPSTMGSRADAKECEFPLHREPARGVGAGPSITSRKPSPQVQDEGASSARPSAPHNPQRQSRRLDCGIAPELARFHACITRSRLQCICLAERRL